MDGYQSNAMTEPFYSNPENNDDLSAKRELISRQRQYRHAGRKNRKAHPCLFRRNDYTSSYANGDFPVGSPAVCLSLIGGALVSTGMLKPKWQAEAPLAS